MKRSQYAALSCFVSLTLVGCPAPVDEEPVVDPTKRKISLEGSDDVELGVGGGFGTSSLGTGAVVVSVSPNQARAAVATSGGDLNIFDVSSGFVKIGSKKYPNLDDLQFLSDSQLLLLSDDDVKIVDISDPENLSIVKSWVVPADPYADSPTEATKLLSGFCILDDKWLALARKGSPAVFKQSPFMGPGVNHVGLSVYDLEAIPAGENDLIKPDFHANHPWLSPNDCFAKDGANKFYASDNNDGGFWPFTPEIVMGLGIAEYGLTFLTHLGTELGKLESGGTPDLSALTWDSTAFSSNTPSDAEMDAASIEHVSRISSSLGGTWVNGFTLDVLAPLDPPGPFALDYGDFGYPTTLRGNGPMWVNMAGDDGTLAAAIEAFDIPTLIPELCWVENVLNGGVNDFADPTKSCVLVFPRFGLESLTFAQAATDPDQTEVPTLVGVLTEFVKDFLSGDDDVDTRASILAKYNERILVEYQWLYNRAGFGDLGTVHEVDFETRDSWDEFVPLPSFGEFQDIFDSSRLALETQLAVDLGDPLVTTTDLTTVLADDYADAILPYDYGADFTYPDSSAPDAPLFRELLGTQIKTWGTKDLGFRSAHLTNSNDSIFEVPGGQYYVAISTNDGWDLLDSDQGLFSALHIGPELPSTLDFTGTGAFPLNTRIAQEIEVLPYDPVNGTGGFGLDSRTLLLVDQGSFAGQNRDGLIVIYDLAALSEGQSPVELYREAMGPGVQLAAAFGLKDGRIYVFGGTEDDAGQLETFKVYRLTSDIPYGD